MDKADKFLKTLQEQVNFSSVETRIALDKGAGYSAECLPNKLIIRAKDPLGLIQGICLSHTFSKSEQETEIAGEHTPIFTLRPFVLEKTSLLAGFFDENASDLQNRMDILCESILALGYNALWVADWEEGVLPLPANILETLGYTAREYGMQFGTALHPDIQVEYVIHYCDVLTKPLSRELNDKGMSKLDVILEEIEGLYSILLPSQKLVLYCPRLSKGHNLLEKILSFLPERCYLAFSSNSDEVLHEVCCKLKGRYKGLLIPIVQTGLAGGGFWPQMYVKGTEEIFSKSLHSLWHTIAVSGTYLPVQGSLYHCLVWSLAQMLWNVGNTFSQWYRQWFKTHCPHLKFDDVSGHLSKLTALSFDIKTFVNDSQDLPYEEKKAFIEMSLSQIKYLHTLAWPDEILDGAIHCLKDLRRILLNIILQNQLAIPQIVDEQDLKGGFWTILQGSPGQAVRSGVVIRMLEIPQNINEENVHWWKGSVFLN